ncbi:MAG: hypothetical protein HZA88_25165 [Verrucomicrobia bacterium]|nr:hypothetical protein [Verrucomicrobiota bacterium]
MQTNTMEVTAERKHCRKQIGRTLGWRSLLLLFGIAQAWTMTAGAAPVEHPRLRAASLEFAILPEANTPTSSRTGAKVAKVAGPLKTTVTLLEDGELRLCLVTAHLLSPVAANVSAMFRRAIADDLKLPVSNVLLFVSHNHSDLVMASNPVGAYASYCIPPSEGLPEAKLLPVGREMLAQLRSHAKRLPAMLQPVTVWWAEGTEGRITYNRKGRRADGSTYLMREEDRDLMGVDFNGDMDRQAPIVVLKNEQGKPVAALAQFTGHPVASYHPEKPVVFGDWPQVACDLVAKHLSPSTPLPVSFMQGCAGDINGKGMFRGGVELAEKYGRMLGESYIKALDKLKPSRRDGLNYAAENARIPLGPLPSENVLKAEIAEMEDFIRRAAAGDQNTLACVGLNFPTELTPAYRGKLIEAVLPWNRWALQLRQTGKAGTVLKYLEVEMYVLRLGDVGIVGMPFEPFLGIGRQIRSRSPLPLAIPCGYVNVSHGYLTDGPNTGDREYMSSYYRYTKFRPPYKKPAGDVLADKGIEILNQFAKHENAR